MQNQLGPALTERDNSKEDFAPALHQQQRECLYECKIYSYFSFDSIIVVSLSEPSPSPPQDNPLYTPLTQLVGSSSSLDHQPEIMHSSPVGLTPPSLCRVFNSIKRGLTGQPG